MKRWWLAVALAAVSGCGPQGTQDAVSARSQDALDHDPPVQGVIWERGASLQRVSGSPDLLYHGGPVMSAGAYVQPIFWGSSWTSGDPKIAAMLQFYQGLGGSTYEATTTEYTDSTGAHVSKNVSVGSAIIDTSAAPRSGNRTSPILAEVCARIGNPVPNGYYPVYVDSPRGHSGYCAWHSDGVCNNVEVQFAFFYNLDGDPGCDPNDTTSGHPEGIAALGNVSGHELSEALTDPHLDAWYDSSGGENADKCAWTFGSSLLKLSNNTTWKVQGNWSNAAYDANTGYTDPNNGFVRGCIDGTN